MSRLPIRARLSLAFASAMAIVLAGSGFLLYDHLSSSLDRTINQGLRASAASVAVLVQQADTALQEAPPRGTESFAQVLSSQGRIVDATRGSGTRPLLDASLLARAKTQQLFVDRKRLAGEDVRLLAIPVRAQDRRLVIVVGMPLRSRDDALSSLRSELLVGGPLALLAVSVFGYLVAAAALLPVERIRIRAASISDRDLSERLPVPRGRDEIGRLGETLNEMLARIERGVARQRAFVADASHELRTPLSLLRAEVELALESKGRTKAELVDALRSIGEETDRLSGLAEDLLLLARLEGTSGELALRTEPLDARELLEGVAERFARRAETAGRTIEVDAPVLLVSGDRLRLSQALGNLVDNSLRYGAGAVRLAARQAGDRIEILVEDEGTGFPEGFLPLAFERFTRADPSRVAGGAGLGLAIVKAIVDAHAGTVSIRREPQEGARVVISLSAAPRPDYAEGSRTSTRSEISAKSLAFRVKSGT